MWPILAPLIDELGGAVIGRVFLWPPTRYGKRPACPKVHLPEFCGDLTRFYTLPLAPVEIAWNQTVRQTSAGIHIVDGHFPSPVVTGTAENDAVHVRRWRGPDSSTTVIGLGGLVQLGYYWFDGLAQLLANHGVDFWMMDEPFNHRRTPKGSRPGQWIAGAGPEQLIAAVRQAVIDVRALVAVLRHRGQRIGVVGQSYGAWIALLLALVEPDIDFIVALVPLCDLPRWYRSALPLARGARRKFPNYSRDALEHLLRPVNPIAWSPRLNGRAIQLHAARFDRLVQFDSIVRLARAWNSRLIEHHAGHYSVFFGTELRHHVARFIAETAGSQPRLAPPP